jgi:integrase
MAQKIVKKWADYSRLGDLSPHDLRRTAITRALESGLTYRQVQMMSKHKDPKTVMRYDHGGRTWTRTPSTSSHAARAEVRLIHRYLAVLER